MTTAALSDDLPVSRTASYPPPYPRGWYRVANLEDIRPDRPFRVTAFGRELVVFRARTSGEVGVLDAYCPHLGAHLGAGGKVRGDCIVCPFHHWSFGVDGRLEDVPWLDAPPKKIRQRAWPARVVHDMVWVFHDGARGGRGAPPAYEPEAIPEIASGAMVCRGSHHARDVRMHIVEFAENSVDFQHFSRLHGDMLVPWTNLRVPLIRVAHEASWEPDPARPHVATFRDAAHLTLLGRALPRSGARATITVFGPGSINIFRFEIPGAGEIVMFHTHTPVEPLLQRVYFRWYAPRRMPRLLVSYVVGSWIAQWAQDLEVWENKRYEDRPCVVRGDGPVHRLRQWYRQFYEEPEP